MMRRNFLLLSSLVVLLGAAMRAQDASTPIAGFHDFSAQRKIDAQFMAVPDPKVAGADLKTLTAAPHFAGSPEDEATAQFVAQKFRDAGLQTEIVPYRVMLSTPRKVSVEAFTATGKIFSGPAKEHVQGDPFQDDPRVLPGYNGSSASGDVTAPVVYANYGTLADFNRLEKMGESVKGKIVIVRYGANFRGVKVYIAQQRGAVGVLIYSDPADDGYFKGDTYPQGPWRPESGVQRGAVQFLFKYPGDPQTPGVASTMTLPDSARVPMAGNVSVPTIPSVPLSYGDAKLILRAMGGQDSPRNWQGALPFTYHMGGDTVKVHMVVDMDAHVRTIWDVIGKIPGSDASQELVVAGNHRDAWVYGAVDPNSGTAAMLEAVRGLGALLKQGWQPRRTIVVASWDAEEEGLIGSTEWVEDNAKLLQHAVAYFNTDVGVSGPDFEADAVPSLKQFIRDVTREVPSPKGGTVYDAWRANEAAEKSKDKGVQLSEGGEDNAHISRDVTVGDLGSGSDYSPFLQHIGVPSSDIRSDGNYGVYHSVFDNYAWFVMNADPTFVYEQQMARVFGLEVLHMADADVLPYDYTQYGREVQSYIDTAAKRPEAAGIDFAAARAAAVRFTAAGRAVHVQQVEATTVNAKLDAALRAVEGDLINPKGLPNRPWFTHTIYAPGEYTGYAAVVIPGVNEALDAKDTTRAREQLAVVTAALNKAAETLEAAGKP